MLLDPSTRPASVALPAFAREAVPVLAALAIAALALWALLAVGGHDPARALGALWRGSFGTGYALLSTTLVRATPLILAGLAVALAFRAGILNIGAEGQLLAGAAAAAAIGVTAAGTLGAATLPVMIVSGAAAGALVASIAALLRRRFGVLEVISTLMLNFVALHLVSFLVRGPLQEPTRIYPQTITLPAAARLPLLLEGSRVHLGLAIAVVLAVALWWALRATAAGFRLRAVGANPDAAATAGVNVARVATRAFLASGALAGLAGAAELSGVTYALYENISPGYGYTAIAVALLARLHPLAVVPVGLLFGGLEAGASAMQRDAGVPAQLVSVVEALLILLVIAADRLRGRGVLGGGGPVEAPMSTRDDGAVGAAA